MSTWAASLLHALVMADVDADDLPFRLVEPAINARSDDGVCPTPSHGSSPMARCARWVSQATSSPYGR